MNEVQKANYRRMQKVLNPIYNMMMDISIMNPQYIIEEGPCLIVSNHRSDLDPFAIIVNVKRPVAWLGASYLWNIPVVGAFFDSIGAIPVSKYRSEITRAFDRAAAELEKGEAVGIFPEGWDYIAENQFDWRVGKFNTGFARIAIQTNSPVVPMALLGLNEKRMPQAFPPFIRKILDYPIELQYVKDRCVYQKLHINVGKPIKPPVGANADDRDAVNEFTDIVNEAVAELYGEIPQDVAGFENIEPKPAGPRWPDEYLDDDEELEVTEVDENAPEDESLHPPLA